MQPPKHAGLRHLALNVRRLDEMKGFYTGLLGFAVEWEPDADNVYLSSGFDNLAFHRSTARTASLKISLTASRAAAGEPAPENQSPLDHFGLIVREADDVDRWAEFLESRGVVMDVKPRTHRDGARSCYFKDPDGNAIQIIYHPPISQKI